MTVPDIFSSAVLIKNWLQIVLTTKQASSLRRHSLQALLLTAAALRHHDCMHICTIS